jgi:peptidoglycan hydrolase-like amidase
MICVACLSTSLSLLLGTPSAVQTNRQTFAAPIDALSVAFPNPTSTDTATVRFKKHNGTWSEWQQLELDDEQDPRSVTSNLVVFSEPSKEVEVKSQVPGIALQPISVSKSPVTFTVSRSLPGTTDTSQDTQFETPRILTRAEWGADESFRTTLKPQTPSASTSSDISTVKTDNGENVKTREKECNDAQFNYPEEFTTTGVTERTLDGKRLLWPETFSKEIKLLVVHHTAMGVRSDTRSGLERMRALYQYHAQSKGWGDVGYRYIIDDEGQIYEGRAGGDHVITGHAYCNNINTLGIALMGNFEDEKPSQMQIASLQWLLAHLANQENLHVKEPVTFHGKKFPSPVVGHRDLLSTTCPGFYVYGVLDQIRKNVAAENVGASVIFPEKPHPTVSNKPYVNRAEERKAARGGSTSSVVRTVGLFAVGGTSLQGLPGEERLISVRYVAGSAPVSLSTSLGAISKSASDIGLWIERNGVFDRLRTTLPSPSHIRANGELTMRVKIQFPMSEGTTTFSIGSVTYTLQASGRRARTGAATPSQQTYTRPAPTPIRPIRTSSSSTSSRNSSTSSISSAATYGRSEEPIIRVRLTIPQNIQNATTYVTISLASSIQTFTAGSVTLTMEGNSCAASQGSKTVTSGILRLDAADSTFGIGDKRYRGVLECRVLDGSLVVINELPLETYLHGVSEEPDTEPQEKQRAFAIAARNYALFYLDAKNRKFPGKPYDASDSAALFQKYTGVTAEQQNPRWVSMVDETRGEVLTKNGSVLKLPYFSSDDGRTKSPAEIGWNTFPFAEVFSSKQDPWCSGMPNAGHGVGMSGCGSEGQANEGKTGEEILQYYYPGTVLQTKY